MKLEGLERHQRLIDSYKKLHVARSKFAARIVCGTHRRMLVALINVVIFQFDFYCQNFLHNIFGMF
jgi:hypothetical protein